MKLTKVFEFRYNPFIEDMDDITISIHKTKKGARKAMLKHIKQVKKDHDVVWKDEVWEAGFPKILYDWSKCWGIEETELMA